MPDDKKSASQVVREWRNNNIPQWRPYHDMMDEEERFLDGDRYVKNNDWHNRDRRQIQIRGRETDDGIRHFLARATSRPRSVEGRPLDTQSDPDQAEVEVALVEQELGNPLKLFEQCVRSTIRDARAIGMGITWMDWCPEVGQWGEMIYTGDDPRRYMWSWNYHPHHLMCDVLMRRTRIDVDKAREMYKAPWLQPDREAHRAQRISADVPLLTNNAQDLNLLSPDDNMVSLDQCWYKNDRTMKPGQDNRPLKPDQRYMACVQGCGYRSDPQVVLQKEEDLPGGLPPEIPQGCPICGGNLDRIDVMGPEPQRLLYAKGRRLVICPSYCSNNAGDDAPLYDGGWPVPSARSFPIFLLVADPRRDRPRGDSDPRWNWDQQLAADNLRTIAFQRIAEHRTYKKLPADGIKNAKGKRFGFRDDDFDTMYADNSAMGPLEVQFFNASGLDPAWPVAFQPIYQTLTQYRGMYDQGPIEQRGDQSGVALQTAAAIGEVPVEEFIRNKNFELSLFYGVVSDYTHATYPMQRLTRLNLDGIDMVVPMWGQDMPNYDFVIEESPDFTGLEKARSEAWDSAQQIMMLPNATPDLIEAWGKFHQVPRSVIRDLVKTMPQMQQIAQQQQMQQQQAQLMQAAMKGGGQNGNGATNGATNGAGMSPMPIG